MAHRGDSELLAAYVKRGDESAFAEVVRRHQDMVLAVCWRRIGNAALAQDAAQMTFLLMVQKARSLRTHRNLAGWLYQTANYQASNLVRKESLRANSAVPLDPAAELSAPEEPSKEDPALNAHLDEALLSLRGPEREAVVLRFFSGRSLRDVGEAQGTTEEAARKRVSRALERMAEFLQRRGVASSSLAAVTAALTLPVQAAPAGFASIVTASARSASLATAASAHAAWWFKCKLAMLATVTVAIPLVWQWTQNRDLKRDNERLRVRQNVIAESLETPVFEFPVEVARRGRPMAVLQPQESNRLFQLLDALFAAESQQRQAAKAARWQVVLKLSSDQAAIAQSALRDAAEAQREALRALSSGEVQFEHVMRFLRAEPEAHRRIHGALDQAQQSALQQLAEEDRRELAHDLALWRLADLQLMLHLSDNQKPAVQSVLVESTYAAITKLVQPDVTDMTTLLARLDAIGAKENTELSRVLSPAQHQLFQNQVEQRRRALDALLQSDNQPR